MKQYTTNFWVMRVTDRDREQIAALAQREGCSASAAVRAAVERALKDHQDHAPAKAEGVLASPRP